MAQSGIPGDDTPQTSGETQARSVPGESTPVQQSGTRCPKCGALNPKANSFCGNCGGPLNSVSLTPEERQRIYAEEKARIEARDRTKAEQNRIRAEPRRFGTGYLPVVIAIVGFIVLVILLSQFLNKPHSGVENTAKESGSRSLDVSLDSLQQALGDQFRFDKPDHKLAGPEAVDGQPRMTVISQDHVHMVEVTGPPGNVTKITPTCAFINDSLQPNTNSLIYLGKLSTLLVGDVPGFADTLLHALRDSMNTGKEQITLGRVVIHFDLKERYHTRMMSVSFERSI